MRIGFFSDSYLPRLDGIAISVETFRKNLEDLGHEVYVFCPKRPEPFNPPSKRIYTFKSTDALLYDEYRNTFPFTRNHIKAIKELKLDIVHVHTPLQIGMLGNIVARKQKLPLVTTCHSDPNLFKDYGWLKSVFGLTTTVISLFAPHHSRRPHLANPLSIDAQIRTYFNNFDLIITPSDKIDKHVKKLGTTTHSVVVSTGFDTSLLPKTNARVRRRKQLGLDEKDIVFISTSRHVKEKRLDFLLRSYALAAKDRPGYVLLMVGDGPELRRLKKLAATFNISGRIKFIGKLQRTELVATLQAADVLVNASLRETQGLVFNEAAAVGLPTIALEPDINPIVVHNKTALIPGNTMQEYAEAITALADHHKRRVSYGSNAQKLTMKYSSHNQAKHLVRLYEQLLTD